MQEVSRERRGPWLAAPPVPQFPASPGSVMNVLCTALGRHAGQLIRSAAQHVDLTDAYMPLKAQMPRLDPGLRRSVVMSVHPRLIPRVARGRVGSRAWRRARHGLAGEPRRPIRRSRSSNRMIPEVRARSRYRSLPPQQRIATSRSLPLVLPCISSWFAASAREPTSTQR
jgi:hypothetical protein